MTQTVTYGAPLFDLVPDENGRRIVRVLRDTTIREQIVRLDGDVRFENCVFERCKLQYGGGGGLVTGCTFGDGCEFELIESAGNTMQFLADLKNLGERGRASVRRMFTEIAG